MCRSPPGTRLWLSATTARAATGKVGVTNNPDHTVQGGIYIIVQGGRCTSWARPAPPALLATPAMTACVPACDHSQETFVYTIKEKYNRAINPSSLYQYVSVSLGTTPGILLTHSSHNYPLSSARYLGLCGTDVVITEAGDQVQDLPPAAADIRAGVNCMK